MTRWMHAARIGLALPGIAPDGFSTAWRARHTRRRLGSCEDLNLRRVSRDGHVPVTFSPEDARTLALPCETLTSRASRGGHSLPGSPRDARDAPRTAAPAPNPHPFRPLRPRAAPPAVADPNHPAANPATTPTSPPTATPRSSKRSGRSRRASSVPMAMSRPARRDSRPGFSRPASSPTASPGGASFAPTERWRWGRSSAGASGPRASPSRETGSTSTSPVSLTNRDRGVRRSGGRESNPRHQLGRLRLYH